MGDFLTGMLWVAWIGLGIFSIVALRRYQKEGAVGGGRGSLSLAWLFQWNGAVERGPYLLTGLIGFGLKHNLDRLVASAFYDKPWGIFNYFIPPAKYAAGLSPMDRELLLTLLLLSLPFIWIGVVLTLRRLRSAGLPLPLVFLFFIPALNLLLFLVLAAIPGASGPRVHSGRPKGSLGKFLDRFIPRNSWGNALIASMAAASFTGGVTYLTIDVLWEYGWTVFVAAPFGMGLMAALLYGYHEPKTIHQSLGVATLSTVILGALLLATAFEGVICLLMAFPIGYALALIGGAIGYAIQRRDNRRTPPALLGLFLFLPLMMGMESFHHEEAPLFKVRTFLDIQAPPQRVWSNVVAFSEISPPEEFLFKIGIAYPVQAQIEGKGAGAIRHCVFSTGPFVEPIEIWDEPRLLKFSVTKNPPPMQEWTPYRTIHPPHLEGFLVSNGGQFRLIPIPGGGTRLEGTTWYQHHMWPASYWKLWSDAIIHRIHLRVLEHIKVESEART